MALSSKYALNRSERIDDNSIELMIVVVVFFYVVAVITLQQWAAIATVFAGFSAGTFTLYKWIYFYRKNKKNGTDQRK